MSIYLYIYQDEAKAREHPQGWNAHPGGEGGGMENCKTRLRR